MLVLDVSAIDESQVKRKSVSENLSLLKSLLKVSIKNDYSSLPKRKQDILIICQASIWNLGVFDSWKKLYWTISLKKS